ncbi:uncharacterized protein LOC144069067 isoform X2 [Stigmatopora argus]
MLVERAHETSSAPNAIPPFPGPAPPQRCRMSSFVLTGGNQQPPQCQTQTQYEGSGFQCKTAKNGGDACLHPKTSVRRQQANGSRHKKSLEGRQQKDRLLVCWQICDSRTDTR